VGLSVGIPRADEARLIPTKPDVYSKSHVGGQIEPDTTQMSAELLRNTCYLIGIVMLSVVFAVLQDIMTQASPRAALRAPKR
jgi:hypothetical protein